MSQMLPPYPEAPAWRVDWETLNARYPWVRALRGCAQDPRHHAEGDVWTHTRRVCEAMASIPAWRALPETDRRLLFTAALLHDVAKPERTRLEPDGRVTARGHSHRGAVLARKILWKLNVPFGLREQIVSLIRYHQVPFFFLERDDPQRLILAISQTARCDHLAILARSSRSPCEIS